MYQHLDNRDSILDGDMVSRPALETIQPVIQRSSFPRAKRPECEGGHLPALRANVMHRFTMNFMEWCLTDHRDSCTHRSLMSKIEKTVRIN